MHASSRAYDGKVFCSDVTYSSLSKADDAQDRIRPQHPTSGTSEYLGRSLLAGLQIPRVAQLEAAGHAGL